MTDNEFQSAMDALVNGNKNGLKAIYDAYMKLIYAVVYDVVKRREDAEDVTSEFFIKMSGKPNNKFDPKGTATRAEVATILMNFCK